MRGRGAGERRFGTYRPATGGGDVAKNNLEEEEEDNRTTTTRDSLLDRVVGEKNLAEGPPRGGRKAGCCFRTGRSNQIDGFRT